VFISSALKVHVRVRHVFSLAAVGATEVCSGLRIERWVSMASLQFVNEFSCVAMTFRGQLGCGLLGWEMFDLKWCRTWMKWTRQRTSVGAELGKASVRNDLLSGGVDGIVNRNTRYDMMSWRLCLNNLIGRFGTMKNLARYSRITIYVPEAEQRMTPVVRGSSGPTKRLTQQWMTGDASIIHCGPKGAKTGIKFGRSFSDAIYCF
jgi:hypothetical protein